MKSRERENDLQVWTRVFIAFCPGFGVAALGALAGVGLGHFSSPIFSFKPTGFQWAVIFYSIILILSIPFGWIEAMFKRDVKRSEGELDRREMIESMLWFTGLQFLMAPISFVLSTVLIQLALGCVM